LTKRELIEALQNLDAPDDADVWLYDTHECLFVPVLSVTIERSKSNFICVVWADD
jgi:hypothetical protein